jgi:hypothetical protein
MKMMVAGMGTEEAHSKLGIFQQLIAKMMVCRWQLHEMQTIRWAFDGCPSLFLKKYRKKKKKITKISLYDLFAL